jgi:hypothetical protein
LDLADSQPFVPFGNDLIDKRFHLVRALPGGQLSIRGAAFAHDALDVRHFFLAPEFICFGRNELDQFA